jgi:hypothetical protein
MGRLRGGPSRTGAKGAYLNRYVTDEQRSGRPIFNATLRAAAKLKGFRRRYTRLLRCEEPTKSSLILASLATAAKTPGETQSLSLLWTPSPQYSITPILQYSTTPSLPAAVRTEPHPTPPSLHVAGRTEPHPTSPSLHVAVRTEPHPTSPPLHVAVRTEPHSTTPPLHHSTTPSLHLSISPSLHPAPTGYTYRR